MKRLAILLVMVTLVLCGCSLEQKIVNVFSDDSSNSSSYYYNDSSSYWGQSESSNAWESSASESSAAESSQPANTGDPRSEAASLIPYYNNKYLLMQLTNEEMADFVALYKATMQFEDSCTYPYPITLEQNNKLAEFLVYECPEMMMYDREGTYTYYSNDSGLITSRTIGYDMDKGTYDSYMAQIQPILNDLDQKARGLSAYDRELFIYRYIIDTNVYSRNAKDAGNTYGLLINHQAKCDGIALTFKWLMDMAGVPNYIITGEMLDHSDGHAWNVVEIDGTCYDLDITHDDLEINNAQDPYIYGLVNVAQSMIRPQYEIRDAYLTSYCPGASDMSGSYHVKNGTYLYDGWSTLDLFNRLMYDCYQKGGGSFSFQFESRAQYDEFLSNTQYYIDQAADYISASFSINWYYMNESQALWCNVSF